METTQFTDTLLHETHMHPDIIKNEIIMSVTVYFLWKNLFQFVLVDIFEIIPVARIYEKRGKTGLPAFHGYR